MDIMGIIKGSMSLSTNLEPLSREGYQSMRWKLAPNFIPGKERDAAYTLYELYERRKKKHNILDNIDRVVRVFRDLERDEEVRSKVENLLDEVYVDGKGPLRISRTDH